MRFFQICDDFDVHLRWYLQIPKDETGENINPWIFTKGTEVHFPSKLFVNLRRSGDTLDFTFADFNIPIVSKAFVDALGKAAEEFIQWIPLAVENQDENFYILNTLSVFPCLNHVASGAVYWTESDGIPVKVGQIRQIDKIVLDADKLTNKPLIFRTCDLETRLLCNEDFRQAVAKHGFSGLEFQEVESIKAN